MAPIACQNRPGPHRDGLIWPYNTAQRWRTIRAAASHPGRQFRALAGAPQSRAVTLRSGPRVTANAPSSATLGLHFTSQGRPEGPADLVVINYLQGDLVHGAGHLDVVPRNRLVSIEGP